MIDSTTRQKIDSFENPKRTALSLRYPRLKGPIIAARRLYRNAKYLFDNTAQLSYAQEYFPAVIARHSSPLMRTLGDSDPRLQKQKIKNLQLAAKQLDGLIIPPGKVFSFWKAVGNPTYKRGYVDGMLLSEGKVVEGVGGGLCQMSNLLFWLFLHAPVKVVERYHHSRDAFPDSGRVLPFGSGATIFYNLIDLQVRNTTTQPLQIRIWLTDTQLKGHIRGTKAVPQKFHVYEKEHRFIKKGDRYYRANELWRDTVEEGDIIGSEMLFENLAPVMYPVDDTYVEQRNFTLEEI